MLFFIILFLLIVVLPYWVYLKKRYKDCLDKKQFLSENLFHSTIWIVLLIVVPFVTLNIALTDPPTIDKSETDYSTYNLEEFVENRNKYRDDQEFLKAYIDRFHSVVHSNMRKREIKSFLLSLDSSSNDLRHWSMAYYHLGIQAFDSATFYIDRVINPDMPRYELLKAKILMGQKADSLAPPFLMREIRRPNGARFESYEYLSDFLNEKEDPELLKESILLPDFEKYLSYNLTRKILLLNGEYTLYYQMIIHWFKADMNIIGVLAALLILVVWLIYLVKLDFFDKSNWLLLFLILVSEMFFCFLTFLIGDTLIHHFGFWDGFYGIWDLFIYSVFGIGAIEEFVKIIPILITLLVYRKTLQPYQYILFSCASALGFAFVENIMYFEEGSFGSIIHGRALTSAVGHMTFSSIFAYGLILIRHKPTKHNPVLTFFLFWFLAALAHGLYDFWLFIHLILFFIMFFFAIVRIWVTLVNNSLNNSENFKYSANFQTAPLQFYLAFTLTVILMFEYTVVAFTEGPSSANVSLAGAAFSGSFLIMFLGTKLASINLIKGYWERPDFSVNPFTDDVVSQNFIGQKVFFESYYVDRGLIEYAENGISGKIVSRQILHNNPPTFWRSYADSKWFLVSLDQPLQTDEFMTKKVLVKFKDAYSSLNAQKFFIVNFLLIPKDLKKDDLIFRKEFHSLGWVFLKSHRNADSQESIT